MLGRKQTGLCNTEKCLEKLDIWESKRCEEGKTIMPISPAHITLSVQDRGLLNVSIIHKWNNKKIDIIIYLLLYNYDKM